MDDAWCTTWDGGFVTAATRVPACTASCRIHCSRTIVIMSIIEVRRIVKVEESLIFQGSVLEGRTCNGEH
jgi:hypothetical protein